MKNKILLFLMILFSFSLAACKKKDDKPLSDTEYYVYYINTAMDKLIENRYTVSLPNDDVDGLVDELMTQFLKVPDDLEALSALPDKVTFQGFNRDGNILYLNFDTN